MILYLIYIILIFSAIQFKVVLINFIYRQRVDHSKLENNPLVSVLIPARNEASNIEKILFDLIQQPYQNIEIIVCNDHSEDGTELLVQEMISNDSRIKLIASSPLETGWLGKNWACYQLSKVALGEYFVFIDADVRVQGDIIPQTIQHLKQHQLGLLSIFPKQTMKTIGEYCTVPLMHYILTTLLPLILVRVSKFPSLSAANGQFMLFDSYLYKKQDPHLTMKSEKVEDIKIARDFKEKGIKVACITGIEEVSCRMYRSYREGISGFSKNMVTFFGNSYLLAFIFWSLTTLSLFFVPYYGDLTSIVLYFSLFLGTKILFSITSRQNVFLNVILTLPQHITMFIILIQSFINLFTKKQQWKGRPIS